MEKSSDRDYQRWEQGSDFNKHLIMAELVQGRELAKQLQIDLNAPSSSSSYRTRESLAQKIVDSYDKALSVLNGIAGGDSQFAGRGNSKYSESPRSLISGSPYSEDSDRDFNDYELKDASRKRKATTTRRWSQQVRINPEDGYEGSPVNDGYSWRKYGQKDILGSKFPRGYYRCTHRAVQGCLATKQVQRSDEDPMILEITYRGRHTCSPVTHSNPPPPENQEPPPPPPQQMNQSPEFLLNFETGQKVIAQTLETPNPDPYFPPFNFPTSFNNDHGFSPRLTNPDACFPPSFTSPATSGSAYFSMSPTRMSGFGADPVFMASQSELNEIVSAATSATSSPTLGQSHTEFDQNFTFDSSRFYT